MATKKISELPLVNRVSGSQVAGGSVLPIVIGGGIQGTTNQISVEDFSRFVNAYNAHTGSAGNTFTGPQIINNNVTITGKLTVNELVATYETASIIYSEGGNIFGNEITDKQQLTGSVNITGSLIYNGVLTTNIDINTVSRLQQTTQSLQVATASLQFHSASVDAQLQRLQQTTQSLQVATASLQFHSASVDAQLQRLQQTTQSLQVATASLQAFTASQDDRNFVISQFTSSTNAHIVGISDFTSSQLNVNLGNSIYTASVDSHIVGISTYTSSVRDTLARVHQTTQSLQIATASLQAFTASQDSRNFVISQYTASTDAHIVGISAFTSSILLQNAGVASVTASLNQFTASQDSRNFVVSQVTGSLIGITNGLMAFTAALDNTYATDAQLYQLYQATRSLELSSGSMIGITNGLMALTASMKAAAIVSSSTQISNFGFPTTSSQDTLSNKTLTNPLIGSFNITADTLSRVGTYGNNVEIFSKDGFLINPATDRAVYIDVYDNNNKVVIVSDLASYETNSKGIVSSSQQIKDYITFVNNDVTSSMSVYSASFAAKVWTPSGTANQFLYQSAGGASSNTTSTGNVTYDSGNTSLNVSNLAIASTGTLASSLDRTNNISLHDGSFGIMALRNGDVDKITTYRGVNSVVKISGSLIVDSNNLLTKHEITGGLDVIGGITGSFKGALSGNATSATNFSITNVSANTNYAVLLTTAGSNGFLSGYTDAFGGMLYNPSTNKLTVSGSVEISGSFNVYGGNITGSILATNGVVSSSQQIAEYNRFAQTSSANTIFYGNVTASGNLQANQLYVGGATTSTGLVGASEAVVQNELGIQYGDATGTYMRLIANGANSNTAIQAGAFSGANPSLDLIAAGGSTAISIKNDAGVNFGGALTASIYKVNSGGGIDFSANSNAAGMTSELLNDYEEGTFTPFVYGDVTAGTATYASQNGVYTKIGRMVHFNMYLDWSSGTGSGVLRIGGLPFTEAGPFVYPACAIGEINNIALTANNIATARVNSGGTWIAVNQYPAGGGTTTSVSYDSVGYIVLSGAYYV